MHNLPAAAMLIAFVTLAVLWLGLHRRSVQLDGGVAFHVALDRRDRKVARLYYRTVWVGLSAAILAILTLGAMESVAFESPATRMWVVGLLRGLALGSLTIVGMVWSQVGERVSRPGSDGRALTPISERDEDANRK